MQVCLRIKIPCNNTLSATTSCFAAHNFAHSKYLPTGEQETTCCDVLIESFQNHSIMILLACLTLPRFEISHHPRSTTAYRQPPAYASRTVSTSVLAPARWGDIRHVVVLFFISCVRR